MDFASGVEIGLLGVWSVGEVGGGEVLVEVKG